MVPQTFISLSENLLTAEDCKSTETKPNCSKEKLKRKVEGPSAQVQSECVSSAVSKISVAKRTKKGVNKVPAEETIVESKTKLLAKNKDTLTRSKKSTGSFVLRNSTCFLIAFNGN